MKRWGRMLSSQAPGSACSERLPAFAALFPEGASSECLLKSLHEAQLLNLVFICKGQIHLPFLKVKLLRKSFKFTVILLSNSFFEWSFQESWILGPLPGEAEGHAKTHCQDAYCGRGPRGPQGGGVSSCKWGGDDACAHRAYSPSTEGRFPR